MVTELYPKIYEKKAKNRLLDKRYNAETNEDVQFNIWYDNLKSGIHIVSKFKNCIFSTDYEILHRSALRQSWAEPVHHEYRLYGEKETFFVP